MFKSARCLPKRRFGIIMMYGINMRFIFSPKTHSDIFLCKYYYVGTIRVSLGTIRSSCDTVRFLHDAVLFFQGTKVIYTLSIRLFWCSSACQGLYHSFIISNRIDLFWIKLLNKRIKKTFCGCIFLRQVVQFKIFFLRQVVQFKIFFSNLLCLMLQSYFDGICNTFIYRHCLTKFKFL